MATYFELCNDVLQELGLSKVNAFSGLTTRLHLDVKNKIQKVNRDVLLEHKAICRERTTTITVLANETSVSNSINGEIKEKFGGVVDISAGTEYDFHFRHEDFVLGRVSGEVYGVYNDNLLFAPYPEDRELTVYYYTYDEAKDSSNVDKSTLVLEDDTSIIPTKLQYKILVNGACYEMKKRENNTRVSHWLREFTAGKMNLNAYSRTEDEQPVISIGRNQFDFRRSLT